MTGGERCPKCGKPLHAATDRVVAPFPVEAGLPTALVQSPTADSAPGLPTALVQSPTADSAPGLPTALVQSPTAQTSPELPTTLVQSPTAEALPQPTELVASPNHARVTQPAPRAKVLAPLPQPYDDEKTTRARGAARPAPAAVTREAPKPDTLDEDTSATGRVVAPYRNAKPDADTGKVAVPFRAVEAPFAVPEDADPEPVSKPSVPLAVAKKKGATQTFDEQVEVAQAVVAPFPVGADPAPPKARAAPAPGFGLKHVVALLLVAVAMGVTTFAVLGRTAKSEPRAALIRDVSAQYRMRPGYVRVEATCSGKAVTARISANGADRGATPAEVPLPTSLPAGEHVLELHLVASVGAMTDVQFPFSLPLVMGKPGSAIEVELAGCAPAELGK